MSLLLLADMVVMAAPVVMVAVVVVLAGQLAVSSTAESCAFLQSLNLERQEVLRPCTRSISSLAEQELRSDLGVVMCYNKFYLSRGVLLHGKRLGPASAVITSFAAIDLGLKCLHLGLAVSGDSSVNHDVSAALRDARTAVL